jgi:DNA-binding NtrC family response regulator
MKPRNVLCVALGSHVPDIEAHLQSARWNVVTARDLGSAHKLLREDQFLVCLLVLNQSGDELIDEIEACIKASRNSEWVGVFPDHAVETFRELILNYFFDYHTHPPDLRYLTQTVGHAYGRAVLRMADDNQSRTGENMGMVGQSDVIEQLRRHIRKVASTNAAVLIGGESGSGKELAAKAIHQCSPRAAGPVIAVNCGAIAPSLIHSELFGYERGSFTGAAAKKQGLIEAANGGTLFLDEIADLSLEMQTNLLRFLQEKTINRVGATKSLHVDVRVVAASHVDLAEAMASGRFRRDLFYRLNVLSITVPALRERKEDLPLLTQYFFERCTADRKSRVKGFCKRALSAMMAHNWPGNVRELYNRVQRAVVMTEHRMITPLDLGLAEEVNLIGVGLGTARTIAERDAIYFSLNRVGRNVTHAARELGISRMTLYRLMEKHGIALDA